MFIYIYILDHINKLDDVRMRMKTTESLNLTKIVDLLHTV